MKAPFTSFSAPVGRSGSSWQILDSENDGWIHTPTLQVSQTVQRQLKEVIAQTFYCKDFTSLSPFFLTTVADL